MAENKKPKSKPEVNKKVAKVTDFKKSVDKTTTIKAAPKKTSNKVPKKDTVEDVSKVSREIYTKTVNDLSVLFLYQDTINAIRKDDVFAKNVCGLIDIVNTYEEQHKINDERTDDFLTAYKTLKNTSYNPKILTANEIDDIDDMISFITVYIKNTLDKNWEEIVDSFKGKADRTDLAEAFTKQKIETQNDTSHNPGIENNQNYSKQNEDFSNANYNQNTQTILQLADLQFNTAATMLYFRDVLKNKIFIYESKPTIYVWLKWIYFAFGIILAVIMLSTAILQAVAPSGFLALHVASETTVTANWVYNNTFEVGGWQNTLYTLVFSFMILYVFWFMIGGILREIKYRKNDNYTFSCSHSQFYWSVFILFLLILLPLISYSTIPFAKINDILNAPKDYSAQLTISDRNIKININNAATFTSVFALAIMQYILIGAFAINLLLYTVIRTIGPKKNRQVISDTIAYYYNELKSGKISLEQVASEFNRATNADIQKDKRRFM